MTKARRSAKRLRRWILIAGIVYSLAALCWLILPYFNNVFFDDLDFYGFAIPLAFGDIDDWGYSVNVAVFLGAILLAQWAFLRPGQAWATRLTKKGRPLRSTVIAAAAMAMLLSVGLIALVLEIVNLWEPMLNSGGVWALWAGMLLFWGVWAWVFFVYWRQGDRYTQLGGMIRGLVAGSLMEALVAIPVHVWATRQRECYCFRGTYTTLVFAGTVLLWAFGPGIILLYMRERYRHARLFPRCTTCGYDLRGSGDICPECGKPAKV